MYLGGMQVHGPCSLTLLLSRLHIRAARSQTSTCALMVRKGIGALLHARKLLQQNHVCMAHTVYGIQALLAERVNLGMLLDHAACIVDCVCW